MPSWKINRVDATEVSVSERGEVLIRQEGANGAGASAVALPRDQVRRLIRYLQSALVNMAAAEEAALAEPKPPEEAGTVGTVATSGQQEEPDDNSCSRCSGDAHGALSLTWSTSAGNQDIGAAAGVMLCEACSLDLILAWNDVARDSLEQQ